MTSLATPARPADPNRSMRRWLVAAATAIVAVSHVAAVYLVGPSVGVLIFSGVVLSIIVLAGGSGDIGGVVIIGTAATAVVCTWIDSRVPLGLVVLVPACFIVAELSALASRAKGPTPMSIDTVTAHVSKSALTAAMAAAPILAGAFFST